MRDGGVTVGRGVGASVGVGVGFRLSLGFGFGFDFGTDALGPAVATTAGATGAIVGGAVGTTAPCDDDCASTSRGEPRKPNVVAMSKPAATLRSTGIDHSTAAARKCD